jgi:hypothetical protein
MAFKSEIGFFLPKMAFKSGLGFWSELAFRLEMPFCQKWLFGSNGCSAETAFRPKLLLSNLKWLFGQKWLFG